MPHSAFGRLEAIRRFVSVFLGPLAKQDFFPSMAKPILRIRLVWRPEATASESVILKGKSVRAEMPTPLIRHRSF